MNARTVFAIALNIQTQARAHLAKAQAARKAARQAEHKGNHVCAVRMRTLANWHEQQATKQPGRRGASRA